jgi:hypothetical protein
MADFSNSAEVNLGALFYSQTGMTAGATEGFRKATYGGVLMHRFDHLAQAPLKVELQALANLGLPKAQPPRRDGAKLA